MRRARSLGALVVGALAAAHLASAWVQPAAAQQPRQDAPFEGPAFAPGAGAPPAGSIDARAETARRAFGSGLSGKELIGTTVTGTANVLDGNRLIVRGLPVWLDGFDAVEDNQTCLDRDRKRYPCGAEAKAALEKLVAAGAVSCKVVEQDKFRGATGQCSTPLVADLSAEMIRRGHGVPTGASGQRYVADQAQARKKKAGIWRGEFQLPLLWRRGEGLQPRNFAGQGLCVIKGTVEVDGTRRWYRPKDVGYERILINPQQGERAFCNLREAWDAGWRLPGPSCQIKAKVLRNGDKRYYLPGDPEWDRTKIDFTKGDRWLCLVGEAEEGGFERCRIKGKIDAKGRRLYYQPVHPRYSQITTVPESGDTLFCFVRDAEQAGFKLAPR